MLGSHPALAWATGVGALFLWVIAVRYRSFDIGVSDGDESLFILIGRNWLRGRLPYDSIWDVKPPGLFLLFAIAQYTVGSGILAARVLTALAVLLGAIALFRFARHHLQGQWIGPAAAIVYPGYSIVLYGLRSRPEVLMAPLIIWAFDLALTERRSASPIMGPRVILCGLLLGMACMIKQTAAFELIVCAGLNTLKRPGCGHGWVSLKAAIAFGAAAALPALAFLAYFALSGVDAAFYLGPFLGAAQRLRGDGIGFGSGVLRFLPLCKPILPLLAGGLLLVAERRDFRKARDASAVATVAIWTAASTVGVLVMRSMYLQYLTPLVAPLLLGSLVVLRVWLSKLSGPKARVALAAFVLLIVGAYPFFWFAIAESRYVGFSRLPAVTATVLKAAGLSQNDALYVVDQEATFYLLSGAALPTRYIQSQHLVCDFSLPDGTPDREIRRIMSSRPPYVIVSHFRQWMVCERPDRVAIVEGFLARDYRLLRTVSDGEQAVDVYCAKGTCKGPQ